MTPPSALSSGTVALYTWGNAGSYFDDVLVEQFCNETTSLRRDDYAL